jgi:cobalt-zinc-cadmium efflux system membrane fusion protein
MQCFSSWRPAARAAFALCLSALFSASLPVHAADQFAVTAEQMQALGIKTRKLGAPGPIEGPAYPARVVLPPKQEYVVSAPLSGVVDQLFVSPNDVVKVGQPLLRLISPELGDLQLRLSEAATKGKLAQQTLQRERMLAAEGIVPQRRVQEAEAAGASNAAESRQAEASLRLAGLDSESVRRVANGGALQDALVLRARTAGTVAELLVRAGQRVPSAEALVRIADTSKLWLDIQIPVARQAQVPQRGAVIAIVGRDAAATPESFGGRVGDDQTLTLRADVTRGMKSLRIGEFVQARVPFAAASAAAFGVPIIALARDGDKAHVFVRTANGFVAKPVTVVASAGDAAQVTGDLAEGQEIAVSSVIALRAAWQGKGGSN